MRVIFKIVQEVVDNYPGDIEAAAETAYDRIQKLPDYELLREKLVIKAVKDLVYQRRATTNSAVRAKSGVTKVKGIRAQINLASSTAVNEIAGKWYRYHIGSKVLGELMGAELPALAESEREKSNGHAFNASLLTNLIPIVRTNRTVKQCVCEQDLVKIVDRVKKSLLQNR